MKKTDFGKESLQTKLILAFKNASNDANTPFNQRLSWFMKNKRVSIKRMAEVVGASESTVDRWIAGEYHPRADQVYTLCRLLEVTPNQLFGLHENDFTIAPNERDYTLYNILTHHGQLTDETILKYADTVNMAQNGNITKFEVFLRGCAEVVQEYKKWFTEVNTV